MIGPIAVEVASAILASAIIGLATLQVRTYRSNIEIRAEIREIKLMLAHESGETSELKASLADCQRNCRSRSDLYIRTEAKASELDTRVRRLEEAI